MFQVYSVPTLESFICHLVTLCAEVRLYRDYFYVDPVLSVPSFIMPSAMKIEIPSLLRTNF